MEYDERSALILVDVQNDFAHPDGSLYVAGGEEVVPVANREAKNARERGSAVVYTQDWHPESTPHFEKDGGIWPVHCVKGTRGAEFHPDLDVEGQVVRKGTGGEDGYSGFTVRDPERGEESPTGLEAILRDRGIERVVTLGLATDYCVKETALDARNLGFDTSILTEGVRAVERKPGDAERALQELEHAGIFLE